MARKDVDSEMFMVEYNSISSAMSTDNNTAITGDATPDHHSRPSLINSSSPIKLNISDREDSSRRRYMSS